MDSPRPVPFPAGLVVKKGSLLDQAVHRGQPEAGPLPRGLGGEEGLEHVRARLLVHSDAGVTHREADVLARPHRSPCLPLILGQVHAPGLDPQHAAVRHRVAGIGHEVEEDLLRGVDIGAHVGQVLLARGDDLDIGRQDAAQEPGQIADEPAEVDRLELEAGATGEAEQLLHHHAAAQRRRHHVPQVRVGIRVARGEGLRDQLGVREDDSKQIVEVVGDAAGELADRLHLLGLAQLLLERAPLRHVLRDGLEAVDRASGPPYRAARESHQDFLAVPAPPCDLHAFDHVCALEAREDPLALVRVRVDVDGEVDGQQLLLGLVAEHPHERGVYGEEPPVDAGPVDRVGGYGEEPPVDAGPVDRVGGVLHQRAVALLRAAQRGFRPAPLGDVGADADHPSHRPIHVADRRVPRLEYDAEDLDRG